MRYFLRFYLKNFTHFVVCTKLKEITLKNRCRSIFPRMEPHFLMTFSQNKHGNCECQRRPLFNLNILLSVDANHFLCIKRVYFISIKIQMKIYSINLLYLHNSFLSPSPLPNGACTDEIEPNVLPQNATIQHKYVYISYTKLCVFEYFPTSNSDKWQYKFS